MEAQHPTPADMARDLAIAHREIAELAHFVRAPIARRCHDHAVRDHECGRPHPETHGVIVEANHDVHTEGLL